VGRARPTREKEERREGPERERREGERSWAAGREPAQEGWLLSFSLLFSLLNYSNNLFEFK
jgi:hypothetical protein